MKPIKLRIMSDLHLEFGPLNLQPIGEDILVLAGDIGIHTSGAEWARDYAREHAIQTVMIAGNHEFYDAQRNGHTVLSTIDDLRAMRDDYFTFLENDTKKIKDVTFVGCTLWTDFDLQGNHALSMMRARQAMNDYRLINYDRKIKFTPSHALDVHEFSKGILREALPRNYRDGPVVVMTHHLPSAKSLDGRYAESDYNAAYASHLDNLIEGSEADLWIHGHTHVSKDYMIGNTRIVCNPRGYDGYELNPDFNSNLIIEI